MSTKWNRVFAASVAVAAILAASFPSEAFAGVEDYRFETVQPQVKLSKKAQVAVRLVNQKTGQPVPDAIIVQNKIEMPMQGTSAMAANTTAAKPDGTGSYVFEADLPMEGEWNLSLAAKVQGEPSTVKGVIKVVSVK